MRIGQSIFSGERPRLADHTIKDYEAQLAKNCDLSRGDLRPFRSHTKIQNLDTGDLKSLYNWKTSTGDFWITSTEVLHFARSPVSAEQHSRVYVTGLAQPRVLTTSIQSYPFDFETDYYKLGVPAPTTAPTIGGSYVAGATYRAYLYTYVVKLDDIDAEEGINSPIANITDYGSGSPVLSGFVEPPTQRSIGKIRIYRISTSGSGASEFRFADEFDTAGVDFSTFTWTDNVAEADLGEVLSTSTFSVPPNALKSIIALKNGSLAGYAGRRVYFSEPYLPHAWPYSYAIDANIRGLGLIGSTIVVLTDENVYLMEGQPEAISQQKFPARYPCLSSRGIVSCELGVFFPSGEGIALVTYDGVSLYSYDYLNRDQFGTNYSPSSISAEYFNNKYFAYHGGGGFILDAREKTLSGISDPLLSSAIHYSLVDDELYFIAFGDDSNPNALYKFQGNKDGTFLEYTYRSKNYIFANETNLSACRIVIAPDASENVANIAANAAIFSGGSMGGGAVNEFVVNAGGAVPNYDALVKTYSAEFKYYGDDTLLFTKTITGTDTFRLPANVLYKRCYYELTGDLPIIMAIIASSMDELVVDEK
jgi:hypothetical protein